MDTPLIQNKPAFQAMARFYQSSAAVGSRRANLTTIPAISMPSDQQHARVSAIKPVAITGGRQGHATD